MKKIVLALVVLMFAAPAWAVVVVNITCTDLGEGKVLVSFDASSALDPNLVRAFGLNIQCDNDANIVDVNDKINPDYWFFPGTVVITGNAVTDYGTAVGEVSDCPDDTLPGLAQPGFDSNGVTLEMASLNYPPDGPGSPNAPAASGPLLTFTVDADTCITISGNVARAGGDGVVMENPDDNPTVNFTGCCVSFAPPVCVGDADDNGFVNPADIGAIVVYLQANASAPFWTVPDTDPAYDAAADVDQNGFVNPADVGDLVVKLQANSTAPFWTVPCPPPW